jgi:outer membrane protein insertion porin family
MKPKFTLQLLILFLFSALVAAQHYPIAELRATGSKRFSPPEITQAAGLEKGKSVTLEQLRDATTKLLGLGTFKEVSYKYNLVSGGLKVEFTVADSDEFVPAEFDNIVWLAPDELLKELRGRVPLFNGELPVHTSGSLPGDVAASLEALLRESGVPANITFLPAATPEGAIRAYTYAAEGVEIKIAQVNLAGASPAFSTQVENPARTLLGRSYHRADLKDFVKNTLLPVYQSRGHLRAEFGEPQVAVTSHHNTQTSVTVTIPVQEGRAYTFGGLKWSGNQVFSAEELTAMLHVAPNQPVDGPRLVADFEEIKGRYGTRGYVKAGLEPALLFDDANSTVRYDVAVREGEQFTMGKLEVVGLQAASAERVRQRWRMREGDPFDPGYLSQFFRDFRLPRGFAFKAETSDGEAPHSLDLTLIFCKEDTKCLPTAPNVLTIEDQERRR